MLCHEIYAGRFKKLITVFKDQIRQYCGTNTLKKKDRKKKAWLI